MTTARIITILAAIVFSFLLFACTEKTYVTNPPPVIPDLRPPLVEWVSVTSTDSSADFNRHYFTVSDTVTLTVSASDQSGIDSVKLYINGFVSSGADSYPPHFIFLWPTLSDSDGVYSLEARAWDASGSLGVPPETGNMGVSPTLLVHVSNTTPPPPPDRTPPVIRWISPAPGSTIRDTVALEFVVTDSSHLDSILVFIDGKVAWILAEASDSIYSIQMNSWRWVNGTKILEVRAYDEAGNIGIGNPVGMTIDNHRVIWVPDDYETIQDAINASVDGDTVRVRAGTYREGVRLMGKNIWLESEDGPETTFITGQRRNDGVRVSDSEKADRTFLRGFTVEGEFNAIQIQRTSGLTILNCIIKGNLEKNGIACGLGTVNVSNCIMDGTDWGAHIDYAKGRIVNSMFLNCNIGLESPDVYDQWVEYGWNLFWNNQQNYSAILNPSDSDVLEDPDLVIGSYKLRDNSPAIDAGDPTISDKDGTRSDIGIYGGPFSF